jgi:hypothetical protein
MRKCNSSPGEVEGGFSAVRVPAKIDTFFSSQERILNRHLRFNVLGHKTGINAGIRSTAR